MSYLVYRQWQLPLDEWAGRVAASRNEYAKAHGLAPRTVRMEWKDTQTVTHPAPPGEEASEE